MTAHKTIHNRPRNIQVRAGFLHCLLALLATLLIVSVWVSPAIAEDNDYPHNYVQNASCNTGTCHSAYGGGAGPDYKLGDISCLFCHDDTDPAGSLTAPTVAGHSSATTSTKYGTWSVNCIDCHHEHLQMQYWVYGAESYVFSGVSDVDGITEYTLTMAGAGWEDNCFAGMVLFPNIDDLYADWSNYGIVGNTSDTITVKGPMLLDGGSWDTPIGTGDKTFAIIYGKGINANVPDEAPTRPVRFFRAEGPNSFADGDTTYDGICEVCHTQTSHHRNDGSAPEQSHNDGTRCTACHTHANGFGGLDHTAAGAVLPVSSCMECHGSAGLDLVGDVHGNQCGLCHADPAGGGPLVEPFESTLPNGGNCTDCHGSLSAAHENIQHAAAPGSGPVTIFADTDHDEAGRSGTKPYFEVTVNCAICHNTDLPSIHGNDCDTCHPTPFDTLGTWDKGCQQGGCHPVYHADSMQAHLPFEDPYDPGNDCNRCHDQSFDVTQVKCLTCHAVNESGDNTPPVTTSNAQPEYDGPAKIDFSITDNGKVGLGRTFYRLDGGPLTAAGKYLTVIDPGSHELEFWSMDQAGNIESFTNLASFIVYEDTTPPTTTSNAQPYYYQGAQITLTATDDSTQGVKNTFFSLNGGPIQTGTNIVIPGTSGTASYTLDFWSEDWAGNVETENSVSFTVATGNATIKLVWWDCDLYPSQAPTVGDSAHWTIRLGGSHGVLVASGSGSGSGWNGINNISVPVSPTPYWVRVDWDSEEDGGVSIFPNISVTAPGQVIRLTY